MRTFGEPGQEIRRCCARVMDQNIELLRGTVISDIAVRHYQHQRDLSHDCELQWAAQSNNNTTCAHRDCDLKIAEVSAPVPQHPGTERVLPLGQVSAQAASSRARHSERLLGGRLLGGLHQSQAGLAAELAARVQLSTRGRAVALGADVRGIAVPAVSRVQGGGRHRLGLRPVTEQRNGQQGSERRETGQQGSEKGETGQQGSERRETQKLQGSNIKVTRQ